ncbi:Di-sulfide bridge nucleocytoplasmic transport domain-containing protein [Sporodiniella umbellata]|nr:Di-sulfide bridge nucleocytoplasmic transport domain-containing protein [Sporodiniella umbellata]
MSKSQGFNFIPKLQPNQRLFDVDSPKNVHQLSAISLTQRYKKRAKDYFGQSEKQTRHPIVNLQVSSTSQESSITRHQNISYTVILYLQLFFNTIIFFTALYVFLQVALVMRQDFNLKVGEQLDALYQTKIRCERDYEANKCRSNNRVPAIENMCQDWEACIQKDMAVAKTKILAEAIAEIINSFTEPISYKTIAFFSVLVAGSLMFSNIALGNLKKKQQIQSTKSVVHRTEF